MAVRGPLYPGHPKDFEATLKVSELYSLRRFKHLNILLQLYRSILRVFAPLM